MVKTRFVVPLENMLEMGLYAAMAPLVLMLISSVWAYPAVLEEVVKWGILRSSTIDHRLSVRDGALVGLVFGLSEAVLYTMNAWQGAQWGAMGARLGLTVPMHIVTGAVIAWSMKNKMGYVGLIIAMVIHAGFNYLVRS